MADNRLQLGIVISADGKAAEQALDRVKGKLGQVSRSTTDMAAAANLARSAFSAMAATLSARELIRTADAYAGMQARLKLVSGSTREFLTAQTELYRISQQNLAPLGETITLYTKLSTSIRDMGKSQADALQVTDLVAKTLRISGASAQESAAALLQFGQALGSGVLQGDELRSILESSPRLARALAEGLGVATGQLKAMGAAGELSSRKVVEALQSQASTIKAEYTNLPLTVSGAWQQMENAATKYIGQTDQAAGSSRKLAEALSLVANNLEAIADPLATVVGAITKIEVGGWLQFRDILDGIKTNLKEMVGLKDAGTVDPEVQRLIAMGQGQVPIADLAAATESQAQYFDGVKRGANDALLAVTKLSEAQKAVASMVIDTARANKVDPAWALAIAQQESGFNQLAKSAAGAQGVMQLMPGTAKQLGVNINDVNENIKGGVLYLKQQQEHFKSLKLATAAYNAGPGNVIKYGGVPPFKETQDYVPLVGELYQKWQQVLGIQGEAFNSARDQAEELKTAYESLKTHQDGMVSAAENFAKVQVEKIKTSLTALEAERKATQDVASAQLASVKTYDEKQAILAKIASQQDDFNRRAADLAREEIDAQQQVIETRKRALETELANADRYNLTIIEQAKIKQAIADADADMAVLAQQRAQAEIAAGQAVSEASKQALALKQKEQESIAGVVAEYERQVEILNRLTQAKQSGAGADLLGRLNQVYQQSGGLPEIVSTGQIQRLQEVLLKTMAVKDAIQEMTKATLAQGKAEQAVREEQLRQNAFWDQLIGRLQEYAQTWKDITGEQHDAFAEISVAMGQMLKNITQVGQAYADMQKQFQASNGGESSELLNMASGLAQAEAALNGMARTLLAVRNQYDVGTQGYKDMTAAAERMMEVQRALSAIEAVLGVIHQATSGDVYTAIPRMIGVAAMMASLGYQTGLGGGSVAAKAAYQPQPGTVGTVFGDGSAQSESISKSLAIIRDNSSNDLNYSAAMLRALENIESALAGATNAIIRGVSPMAIQGLGHQYDARKFLDPLGGNNFDPLAGAISKFVFSVDQQITDFGIQVLPHTIKKMFQNGFQAATYTDVTTTSKMFGVTMSKSTRSYFQQLDAEVNKQFTGVITNIAVAVKDAGEALGISGAELTGRLNKFVIDIGRVSLANLKGEELQKKIEEMFSTMSDQIAQAVAPGLGKFRQVGEGYFTTLIRVSEGIRRATGELEQLGMTAINYKSIERKQGDVAAEIVRQTLVAQSGLAYGVQQYIGELTGSAEDIISAYKQLKNAQTLFTTAGFDPQNLDRVMINAAGGLDAFVAAMERYNETFLTAGERLSGQVDAVAAEFMRLGVAMPDSLDGFRALVEGIDTSTESGKKLFGALMQVSEGFVNMQQELDKLRDKYSKYLGGPDQNAKLIKDVHDDFDALVKNLLKETQTTLVEAGDYGIKTLMDRKAALEKDRDVFIGYRDTAERDKQTLEERKTFLEKKRRDSKLTKKEEAELAGLPAKIQHAKGTVDMWNTYITQSVGAIGKAQSQIEDYLRHKSGDELANLIKAEGDALLGTLADIWDKLSANLRAAQETFAQIGDTIAQLKGEAAGPQGVIDYKAAKASVAVRAALDYSGTDAGTLNKLYADAYQAVMDEYNARLDQLNAEKSKYEAIKQAAEQALQTLDATAKGLQDLRNTIAQNLNELAKAGDYNSTEYETRKYGEAKKAIQDYFAALNAGGQRNVETELKLLEDARQAVMDKYQAEVDAIMRANQAKVDALNAERDAAQKAHDERIKGLEEQKRAAEELFSAVERVRDYAKSLVLGDKSTLSPEAKLAEAQRQYQELLTKANSGDAKAIGDLTGASDAYLEAAKTYYGSGSAYSSVFDGVRQAMEAIGGMDVADPNSIQAKIDELNAAHEVYLKSIDEKIKELSDPEKNEAIKALREKAAADLVILNGFADKTQKEVTRQREIAEKELADANAHLAPIDANIADLKNETAAKLQALSDRLGPAIDAAKEAASKQMADLIQQVKDTNILNADQLAVLAKMANSMGVPGYARGGYAPAGMALVGEKGPELVRFERPAQVMTAEQTRRILTPKDDAQIAQAIGELKAEMRAVVVTQSGTNPILIDRLTTIEQRLSTIERTNRIKA